MQSCTLLFVHIQKICFFPPCVTQVCEYTQFTSLSILPCLPSTKKVLISLQKECLRPEFGGSHSSNPLLLKINTNRINLYYRSPSIKICWMKMKISIYENIWLYSVDKLSHQNFIDFISMKIHVNPAVGLLTSSED